MSDLGPITIGSGGPGAGSSGPEHHVWYPTTQVAVVAGAPTRLARVWNRDWTYVLQLAPDSVTGGGEMFTATLPVDHELAAQLHTGARPNFLTVDEAGLRWVGRLHEWKILKAVRNGGCPECEHCQEQVMEIVWVKHPEARMMPLAAFS